MVADQIIPSLGRDFTKISKGNFVCKKEGHPVHLADAADWQDKLEAGQIDGCFFGLLALGNMMGQTLAHD